MLSWVALAILVEPNPPTLTILVEPIISIGSLLPVSGLTCSSIQYAISLNLLPAGRSSGIRTASAYLC